MKHEITVLALEDEAADAEILRRHLEDMQDPKVRFIHCSTVEEARPQLVGGSVDITFLDYGLGAAKGADFLRQVRREGMLEPVIVVTGRNDPYLAAELTKAGADAYIVKDDLGPESLRSCIDRATAEAEDRKAKARLAEQQSRAVRQRAELNEELVRTSRVDALTGLLNRRAWEESLELESERSSRHDHSYSIILLDLDHFKLLNDSQGHAAGDKTLQAVSHCLAATCRKTDMIGRYGGEEMILLLPETDLEQATDLAERIRKTILALNLSHDANRVANRVTASFGVACATGGDGDDVIKRAVKALYAAKELGRNRVCADGSAPATTPRNQTDICRIVVVDDDACDVELLRRQLEGVPRLRFELINKIDLDGLRSETSSKGVDVVFLDYVLGAESGLEIFKGLRATGFSGPIICLTGQGDEKIAAELIRHGADDYLVKTDLEPEILRRALENASMQHRRREIEAENKRLLTELSTKNEDLEAKNRQLAEKSKTA